MAMSRLESYGYETGARPKSKKRKKHTESFDIFDDLFMTIAENLTESETNEFCEFVQRALKLPEVTNKSTTTILTKLYCDNVITKDNLSFLKRCLERLNRKDLLLYLNRYISRSTANICALSLNPECEDDDYALFPGRSNPKRHSTHFDTFFGIPSLSPLADKHETSTSSLHGSVEHHGIPTNNGSDPHFSDFSISSAEQANGSVVNLNHIELQVASTDDDMYRPQLELTRNRELTVEIEQQPTNTTSRSQENIDESTDNESDPHFSDFSLSSTELANGSLINLNQNTLQSAINANTTDYHRSTSDDNSLLTNCEKPHLESTLAQNPEPKTKPVFDDHSDAKHYLSSFSTSDNKEDDETKNGACCLEHSDEPRDIGWNRRCDDFSLSHAVPNNESRTSMNVCAFKPATNENTEFLNTNDVKCESQLDLALKPKIKAKPQQRKRLGLLSRLFSDRPDTQRHIALFATDTSKAIGLTLEKEDTRKTASSQQKIKFREVPEQQMDRGLDPHCSELSSTKPKSKIKPQQKEKVNIFKSFFGRGKEKKTKEE